MSDQVTGLFGNYLGIVIQNNDPEKKGRVKIFIPHLVTTPIAQLQTNEDPTILQDRIFRNIDNPDLYEILQRLKRVLPWAEPAGPLFGGNASGRFIANQGLNTTSSNVAWASGSDNFTLSNRPASRYTNTGVLHDGFENERTTGTFNPFSFQYVPSDYSSLAAGAFTIPNVGAHIWVFFQNGNYNLPVYWASSYGVSDFKRIYTTDKITDFTSRTINDRRRGQSTGDLPEDQSVDYPSSAENGSADQGSSSLPIPDSYTFRAKHVINTNKHTFELIDTDGREIIKLTHFSGGFLEFNNNTTVAFAPHNDQKLVLGNQFETVRTNKNLLVNENYRVITEGDFYLRVGDYINSLNTVDVAGGGLNTIKQIIDDVNKYKSLFDMRRIGRNIYNSSGDYFDLTDSRQESPSEYGYDNSFLPGIPAISVLQQYQQVPEGYDVGAYHIASETRNGYKKCFICKNMPYKVDQDTWNMSEQVVGMVDLMAIYLEPVAALETPVYEDLLAVEERKVLRDSEKGHGFYKGNYCDVCSSYYLAGSLRRAGFTPSTEGGHWKPEDRKHYSNSSSDGENIWSYYTSKRNKLNELLNKCRGGDYIEEIHKNKITAVGLLMNDALSYRVDPIGKLRAESVHVAPEGLYISGKPSPLVEIVDVAEVPGGNYILTAGNKLKFVVGAKGINMKTFGPIEMYGTLCQYSAEQMNISSQNEINLDAGERLLIRARKTIIVSRDHEPVLVESPLHVSKNLIVNGGAYIHGEVGLLHMTAPREYGKTSTPTFGGGSSRMLTPPEEDVTEVQDPEAYDEPYEKRPPLWFTWNLWAAGEIFKFLGQSAQGINDGLSTVAEKMDDVAGAVLTAIGGGLIILNAYRNWLIHSQEVNEIKKSLEDLRTSVNDLQAVSADHSSLLDFLKTHEHFYARVPTNFMNSDVAVRTLLTDDSVFDETGINSRSAISVPTAFTSGGGPYMETIRNVFNEHFLSNNVLRDMFSRAATQMNGRAARLSNKLPMIYGSGQFHLFEWIPAYNSLASLIPMSSELDEEGIANRGAEQTVKVRTRIMFEYKKRSNYVQYEAQKFIPNTPEYNHWFGYAGDERLLIPVMAAGRSISAFITLKMTLKFQVDQETGEIPISPNSSQLVRAELSWDPARDGNIIYFGRGEYISRLSGDGLDGYMYIGISQIKGVYETGRGNFLPPVDPGPSDGTIPPGNPIYDW